VRVRGTTRFTGLLFFASVLVCTAGEGAMSAFPSRTRSRELAETAIENVELTDALVPAPVDERTPTQLGFPFQIGRQQTYNQTAPAVGFDGLNYLVVWEELRGSSRDIYGIQVAPSCSVLTPKPIVISAAPGDQLSPALAFDGTNYFVVWSENRGDSWDICGTRVTQAGDVVDAEAIAVSTETGDQSSPTVAFDGTSYLVVWSDRRRGTLDIYGARVQPSGVVADPEGIPISVATSHPDFPAIASGATGCFVVWQDFRNGTYDIYGARVDSSGVVLDPDGIAISCDVEVQQFPDLAFDGTNYLVVWSDKRGGDRDIYGARVESSGAVLDPQGIEILSAPEEQWWPSVRFDGTNYFVVWEHENEWLGRPDYDIYGTRVNQSGGVLDPYCVKVSQPADDQRYPALAFDGTNYLAVWQDRRGSSWDVWATPVSTDGTVLDPDGTRLSTTVFNQLFPAVGFDGTNYLVAWEDYRSDTSDIYVSRVSSSGTVLDPYGIAVSTAPFEQWFPAVASDGSACLVVWEDYRSGSSDIFGSRVSSSGTSLDLEGIAISAAAGHQRTPAVAFDGANYLVVWVDERSGGPDIYGTRIGVDGIVLDPDGIIISASPFGEQQPSLAFDGSNYLVVWSDERMGSWDIYGAFVSRSGTIADGPSIRISSAACDETDPRVAFDGANYLIVWEDCRGGSRDIYAARVTPLGNILDPEGIPISVSPGYEFLPAVTFAGANHLVVWEDYYRGWRGEGDVYGSWVGTDGSVHVPEGFPISETPAPDLQPAVVQGNGCATLIVYALVTSSGPFSQFLIWGTIWTGPTGVLFLTASATGDHGYVNLSWQMGEDVPASSFSVKRGECLEGEFQTLDAPVLKTSTCSFSCTDYTALPGRTYWYRIVLAGTHGEEMYGPIEVHVSAVPAAYSLYQNYPNPFNPVCTILYEIPREVRVSLRVFDATGSLVRTLVNARREPGVYSVPWDGKSEDGTELPSGVYFYRLEAGDFASTRKTVLLR